MLAIVLNFSTVRVKGLQNVARFDRTVWQCHSLVIRDSILLITSLDAALLDPVTDFYDVTDLIDETSDLVAMVKQHVDPDSWSTEETPGTGQITLVEKRTGKSCLVISQTEKNHRRCRDLLVQLRKALQDDSN